VFKNQKPKKMENPETPDKNPRGFFHGILPALAASVV